MEGLKKAEGAVEDECSDDFACQTDSAHAVVREKKSLENVERFFLLEKIAPF